MQLNTEVNNFSPICIYDARTCLVFWPQFCQSGVTYLQQVLIINIHQLSSSVIYLANWTHFVEYKFIFLNIFFFNRNPSALPFTCLLQTPHDLHNVEFASVWELCRSHVWPSSHAPACHRIGIHAELISGSPNALLGPWSKYPTSALSLFHSACCLLSLQISIQKQSWVIIGINTEINWIRTKTQCLCKPHLYPSFTPVRHSKLLTVLFLWVDCCQIGAYTSGQTFPCTWLCYCLWGESRGQVQRLREREGKSVPTPAPPESRTQPCLCFSNSFWFSRKLWAKLLRAKTRQRLRLTSSTLPLRSERPRLPLKLCKPAPF